jgi:hypothetical protein
MVAACDRERHKAANDETHQELPTVFEPFCSARRRYCAALNYGASASQLTWRAEYPIGEWVGVMSSKQASKQAGCLQIARLKRTRTQLVVREQ